jgi:hypothetical protein
MLRRCLLLCAGVLAFGAPPAAAQDTTTAVRPGMTEADVRTRWGEPLAVRRVNDWTFMFYANGQRHYGYDDVVMLQGGQVMDAVVRAPEHVYLGQSSSPPDRLPQFTPPRPPRPSDGPGAVTGVRVNAPTNPPAPPQPEA